MNNYTQYINALRACAEEHKDDTIPFAHIKISMLCSDVADLLERLEQEPKTGHWINYKDEHQCSQCMETIIVNKDIWKDCSYEYCPNCGIKIESKEMFKED